MFGKNRPTVFESSGKDEISLTMHQIRSWDDHGYSLSMSHYVDGEIEGGHQATIWGLTDDYWRGSKQEIETKLRMNVQVRSDLSRMQMERGILGGGQFHAEYVDVELNLKPSQVRDIVNEHRLSVERYLHVGGYAISSTIFRVTRFGMSEVRRVE